MVAKGRPPQSADAIRQKVADYCSRYGITDLTAAGLPPFPSGNRETPQHREWIVLYKAVTRLQRRESAADPVRKTALDAQHGLCPVCLEAIGGAVGVVRPARSGTPALVLHTGCHELLRQVERLGASVLDRLRDLSAHDEGPDPADHRPPPRKRSRR